MSTDQLKQELISRINNADEKTLQRYKNLLESENFITADLIQNILDQREHTEFRDPFLDFFWSKKGIVCFLGVLASTCMIEYLNCTYGRCVRI